MRLPREIAPIHRIGIGGNAMSRTAQDYATDYNLFAEYIDPDATVSREEFEAMTENERLALIESVMAANS